MELPIIIVGLFFVLSCNAKMLASDSLKERPCNLAFKCSLQEDPVWATDGTKCYVFRNPCILGNENCNRQNRYLPVLESISQEKCQALCEPICPKQQNPVCGYYKNKKLEFSNQCMMDFHICLTGQTYMLHNEGPCEEPLDLGDSATL